MPRGWVQGLVGEWWECLQDGRAWPNYMKDYSALVDTAVCARARVVAANAPRRYVSLVGRMGAGALQALPSEAAASLPPASVLTPVSAALRYKIVREFAAAQDRSAGSEAANMDTADARVAAGGRAPQEAATRGAQSGDSGGECPYVGLRLSDNFLAAQGLWDACMADSILAALGHAGDGMQRCGSGASGCGEGSPARIVMHVCGKFHMEEKLGICERLAERAPDVAVRTVVLVPVDLPAVRHALRQRPLSEYARHETVPGMPCSVERFQSLADFVVLTDGNKTRSF